MFLFCLSMIVKLKNREKKKMSSILKRSQYSTRYHLNYVYYCHTSMTCLYNIRIAYALSSAQNKSIHFFDIPGKNSRVFQFSFPHKPCV